MRFQDAARDARAVVYAGIQADPLGGAHAAGLLADATLAERILARAVMNGETTDADRWRAMFPTLFGSAADANAGDAARSEAILEASLAVADRGEQVRSQVRGALVEELTARLLARRAGADAVRRERRILFDGVRAEIHPIRRDGRARRRAPRRTTASGARAGINADVLHQLDDARSNAAGEDETLAVALVVFDARRSCDVRLAHQTAPHEATRVVTIETLDGLAEPGP